VHFRFWCLYTLVFGICQCIYGTNRYYSNVSKFRYMWNAHSVEVPKPLFSKIQSLKLYTVKAAMIGIGWSKSSINWKLTVNMTIKKVKYWCFAGFLRLYIYIYIPCYASSDEKKIENVARKPVHHIKCHIRWLSQSMRLLGSLKLCIRYNILISKNLLYPATLWSWGCHISQLLLYMKN
jgi:hypothetical protein